MWSAFNEAQDVCLFCIFMLVSLSFFSGTKHHRRIVNILFDVSGYIHYVGTHSNEW